jgi:hypothetical protein
MGGSVHSLKTITIHIMLKTSKVAIEACSNLDVLRRCLCGIRFLLWKWERPWKERSFPRLTVEAQCQKYCLPPAKTYRQREIALDAMSYRISKDHITKGPVSKGEVGAGIWKCPKTNFRISIEKRRVLYVMRI